MAKVDFYYLLKKDQNQIFKFLNILSPCPHAVKMVFHPILHEMEVHNFNFKQ